MAENVDNGLMLEILKEIRKEQRDHREARPDDDVHVPRTDPAPLVGTLAVAEAGVDQRDTNVEIRAEPVDERHRHRDLRHEDQRRAARLE